MQWRRFKKVPKVVRHIDGVRAVKLGRIYVTEETAKALRGVGRNSKN